MGKLLLTAVFVLVVFAVFYAKERAYHRRQNPTMTDQEFDAYEAGLWKTNVAYQIIAVVRGVSSFAVVLSILLGIWVGF